MTLEGCKTLSEGALANVDGGGREYLDTLHGDHGTRWLLDLGRSLCLLEYAMTGTSQATSRHRVRKWSAIHDVQWGAITAGWPSHVSMKAGATLLHIYAVSGWRKPRPHGHGYSRYRDLNPSRLPGNPFAPCSRGMGKRNRQFTVHGFGIGVWRLPPTPAPSAQESLFHGNHSQWYSLDGNSSTARYPDRGGPVRYIPHLQPPDQGKRHL